MKVNQNKEKSEPRTCPKCRIFDRYEPYKKGGS